MHGLVWLCGGMKESATGFLRVGSSLLTCGKCPQ